MQGVNAGGNDAVEGGRLTRKRAGIGIGLLVIGEEAGKTSLPIGRKTPDQSPGEPR